MNNIASYITSLEKNIYEKISNEINASSIDRLVNVNLKFHISDAKSSKFQRYYFHTVNEEQLYLNASDFFRQFKSQYSLQGIDNQYLDMLENNKTEILRLIRGDELTQLYFGYFCKVKLKYGDKFMEKDLGSFFAKLVHTFRPEDYCALDNPIKIYFGLTKESFFMSFQVISKVYADWANSHREMLNIIRQRLIQIDNNKLIKQEKLTDLKLLDLIFWTEANIDNN